MTTWDHTAQISAMLHGLISIVANGLSGKSNVKPREPNVFNPFRNSDPPKENRITSANFKTLKFIGHNIARGR